MQAAADVPLSKVSKVNLTQSGDLGVEIGVPDFQCKEPESLLPEWAEAEPLSLDIDPPTHGEGSDQEVLPPTRADNCEADGPLMDCSDNEPTRVENFEADGPLVDCSDNENVDIDGIMMTPSEDDLEFDGPALVKKMLDEADTVDVDGLTRFMPNCIAIAA